MNGGIFCTLRVASAERSAGGRTFLGSVLVQQAGSTGNVADILSAVAVLWALAGCPVVPAISPEREPGYVCTAWADAP
jgi:hypothetical protein